MTVKIYPTKWTPKDKEAIRSFLKEIKKQCEKDVGSKDLLDRILKLHPAMAFPGEIGKNDLQAFVSEKEVQKLHFHKPIKDLYIAILIDPEINMFFHQMFWQQDKDGVIDNWQVFIVLLDLIMTYAPVYSTKVLVGFPINTLLNWPMATTAGFACFLNSKVNALFKNILNYWGVYLQSLDSTKVLNDSEKGWLSPAALEEMKDVDGNTFEQQFICDPTKPHWGFKSWDNFFTRKFRDGMRPLTQPDDPYTIANACESAPFKIDKNVQGRNMFWIKDQPYSLFHMLNNSDLAQYFVGGTVYQAFLSATSYHRWHSPISGKILKVELIEGSYYSQTYEIQGDHASPNMSQGYLSQVAARAAVYIQADNTDVGIMCFLSIGMSEVSSNEVTVKVGDHVAKGDELGMFHFGGSTHCLIFRPQLEVTFDISPNEKPGLDAVNIPLRRKIATVRLK